MFCSANFYKAASWILKGYNKQMELNEDERNVLFLAIKARAAQSVIGAYYTVSIEPENRVYLMSEASKAEIILQSLAKIRNEEFYRFIHH